MSEQKITLEFKRAADLEEFCELLEEKAMEIEDDGNEGDPRAAILWNAAKQIRKQKVSA